jgi:hypothetical protein
VPVPRRVLLLPGRAADAQFELTDALLCADGPVRSPVDLSLAPEHRRGHGALSESLFVNRSRSVRAGEKIMVVGGVSRRA